jgi:DNA-binding NtrC family response regulator
LAVVRRAVESTRLAIENEKLRCELALSRSMVFASEAMQRLALLAGRAAPRDVTVLISGESGTGKERLAEAIVAGSRRADKPFVRFNCAALTPELAEAELFGHTRGAFTGAVRSRVGLFGEADGGTILLDEIGELAQPLQAKLLRVLQSGEIRAVGEERERKVDVRVLAATNADLQAEVRRGTFREDLFYRLNVFPIEIPPLRERRQDIPLLVNYFVSKLSRRMRKEIKSIPKQAMELLMNSPWRGNVRELSNFIERAVILSQGDELEVPIAELKASYSRGTSAPASTFQEAERNVIIDALKAASGQISGVGGAATRLGLKRSTLQNKMRRLGISKKDYGR